MAKKQTRRSISVNRVLFDIVKMYCDRTNTPMSQLVEDSLRVALAKAFGEELGENIGRLLAESRQGNVKRALADTLLSMIEDTIKKAPPPPAPDGAPRDRFFSRAKGGAPKGASA